ncbi:MAG: NAD(P)/FAD-dependent oxidoreductase [Pseudohongiellaceae bacterium]
MTTETRLDADVAIIGAGAVGLAIARTLARQYRSGDGIVLLERNAGFGEETSSRNSEVIHAGLYYPPDSLKARHCLRGRERLYEYCRQHAIPFQQLGKLVVAHDAGQPALEALHANALASGVAAEDLQWLDGGQLQRIEPALSAGQALWSGQSGIVDSHAFMQTLLNEALSLGVTWAPMTRVEHVDTGGDDSHVLRLASGSRAEPVRLRSRILINAAGLGAEALARQMGSLDADTLPGIRLVKGQYFAWNGPSPFNRLIYPLPPAHGRGLGIHATLDLSGRLRFGPDTETVDMPDYHVDESRRSAFVEAIQDYFPGVEEHRLVPDYAGIRAQAVMAGQSGPGDFIIREESAQGLPGLVQLFGIDSPGLTAALSIAESVSALIADPPRRYAYRPR